MSMLRSCAAAGFAAAVATLMSACGGGGDAETASAHTESAAHNRGHHPDRAMTLQLRVLSSAPQWVSGGDARIHVRASPGQRDKIELVLNGKRVDVALEEVADGLEGVVSGLRVGHNWLEARHRRAHHSNSSARDAILLTNWPITGPMFTGPQQTPFVCTATQFSLLLGSDQREVSVLVVIDRRHQPSP